MCKRATAVLCALVASGIAFPSLALTQPLEAPPQFQPAADSVAQMVGWVFSSGDNGGRPFIIIDKVNAEVFAFDGRGVFMGQTPALIGVTPGDFSKPGIGDRELREISPEERTTPAGRFAAGIGPAPGHRSVLWVDYRSALALHAVVNTKRRERRPERLRSTTSEDNRISYGCINVSHAFYNKVVRPLFTDQSGVVYILPETLPLNAIFPTFRPLASAAGTEQH